MFSCGCCSILRKCYKTVEKFSVLQITKSQETFSAGAQPKFLVKKCVPPKSKQFLAQCLLRSI